LHGKLKYESIRKNGYKLIREYRSGITTLYNLTADITESKNIFKDNKELASQMIHELKKIGPCYDFHEQFIVKMKNGNMSKSSCEDAGKNNTDYWCTFPEVRMNCRYTCTSAENVCS